MTKDDDAKAIAEDLLRKTGDALRAGNFEAFIEHFSLPYHLETLESTRDVGSMADMNAIFEAVCRHLESQHVTLMSRHCVAASFRSDTEIVSTHETRLIHKDILIEDPFATLSVIKRDVDEKWRIISSAYVVDETSGLGPAFKH